MILKQKLLTTKNKIYVESIFEAQKTHFVFYNITNDKNFFLKILSFKVTSI